MCGLRALFSLTVWPGDHPVTHREEISEQLSGSRCAHFDVAFVIPTIFTPQALVGLERGSDCFNNPVFPDDEGLTLLPYTGDDCLTYEGEINKLAVNVAFGRCRKSDPVHRWNSIFYVPTMPLVDYPHIVRERVNYAAKYSPRTHEFVLFYAVLFYAR